MFSSSRKQSIDDLKKRGYSDAMIKSMNDRLKATNQSVTSGGLRFSGTPTEYRYSLLGYILVLFEQYEKGNLPFPGSVTEQPSQIIEIFSLLNNLKIEREIQESKGNG